MAPTGDTTRLTGRKKFCLRFVHLARDGLRRELHDSVSQALYGIALGARTLLDRTPEGAAEPLDYVLSLAEAGLAEMRALIFELLPEALETEGLVAALGKQTAAVQARHGLAITTRLDREPAATLAVKEALYRIAQEALHNIVKHARARNVQLRLEETAHELVLEVSDDGVGFAGTGSFPGHLGLHTMRDRATRLGGTLEIVTAPGSGTCIRVRLPATGAS
jgi:signal transduction histidine kinase